MNIIIIWNDDARESSASGLKCVVTIHFQEEYEYVYPATSFQTSLFLAPARTNRACLPTLCLIAIFSIVVTACGAALTWCTRTNLVRAICHEFNKENGTLLIADFIGHGA